MRATALFIVCLAASARAQIRPEVSAEFVSEGKTHRAEAGIGLNAALGPYLRGALNAAYDVVAGAGVARRGRAESTIRFLLDPTGTQRWALSFAGGIGFRERPYLVVAADLEGPRMRSVRPAVRAGLGGGVRLAVVVRGARPGRR